MMVLKTASTVLIGALLAGCAMPYSPAPVATNFPTSNQDTLRAASHWQAIASHLEQKVIAEMKKGPVRPFYIAEQASATPFQRALTSHLITALVNDGYVVARAQAGSLKIDIDLQSLSFSPDRKQYADQLTALATGVWVQGNELLDRPAKRAQSHFSQVAGGQTPKTEVIVTVSVSDQHRYYARSAAAYYVAETDRELYGIAGDEAKEASKMKMFQVRGDR